MSDEGAKLGTQKVDKTGGPDGKSTPDVTGGKPTAELTDGKSVTDATDATERACCLDLKTEDEQRKKEIFTIGLEMQKGYYEGIEKRLESASTALLLAIGWFLLADTKKTVGGHPWLLFGAWAAVTALVAGACIAIAHFFEKWFTIQANVESLNYAQPAIYARYWMDKRKAVRYLLAWLLPILAYYLILTGLFILAGLSPVTGTG